MRLKSAAIGFVNPFGFSKHCQLSWRKFSGLPRSSRTPLLLRLREPNPAGQVLPYPISTPKTCLCSAIISSNLQVKWQKSLAEILDVVNKAVLSDALRFGGVNSV